MSASEQSTLHQFIEKVLPGIFDGHGLHAGRHLERRYLGRGH